MNPSMYVRTFGSDLKVERCKKHQKKTCIYRNFSIWGSFGYIFFPSMNPVLQKVLSSTPKFSPAGTPLP